jgi:hypothetical protein
MWNDVGRVLSEAFSRLSAVLVADLPALVAMLLVLAGALVLAVVVRAVLRRVLRRMGFDRRAREWGMTTGRSLAPHHEPSWLVARGAYWFMVVAGVAVALDVLGASTTSALGFTILNFLPRLVVSIFIFLVGIGAARFLERSVLIGAVNRQIQQARYLALAVKWVVLVLAAAMALEHVGVAGKLATLAFGIVLGGIMLAVALAVGLGARETVARALERRLPQDSAPPADEAKEKERIQHL